MSEPKTWPEYGEVGSVYYESNYGYFRLKKEGSPFLNKWFFPDAGG